MKSIIGKYVRIYDGSLIGWTTGKIVRDFGNNRVQVETKEGYVVNRWLKYSCEEAPDGSAYLIK